MGMKGKVESKPLSEERAVEMGSEIIGEAFLYSVAAAYIVFEYWRSTRKDKRHEEVQNREISDLHLQTQRLEGQVAQLQLTLESLKTELGTHLESGNNDRSSSSNEHSDKPSSWWTWRS